MALGRTRNDGGVVRINRWRMNQTTHDVRAPISDVRALEASVTSRRRGRRRASEASVASEGVERRNYLYFFVSLIMIRNLKF